MKKNTYVTPEAQQFGYYSFGPTPTEPEISHYEEIGKLLSFHIDEKKVSFCFASAGQQRTLTLFAPENGGIRLCSVDEGFFKPDKLMALKVAQLPDGFTFQTADGSAVTVSTLPDMWQITLSDESGKVQTVINKDTFRFGYDGKNLEKVKISFPIEDEMLFGCGERFSGLDQTGNRHQFWNCDSGYHGNSEHFELWKSYKNVPLIHSTRGFSLFFSSFYPAISDIGYNDENNWSWEFWGATLDMYIWTGNVRKTVVQYTNLTGKPFLPPRWAFHYMSGGGNGFWYGENWGEGNIPEKYLAVLKNVLEGYEALGTPNVAALYGEGYMADNDEAYKMLKQYGTRMLNWNPPDYPIEVMRSCLPGVPDQELPRIKDVNDPEKDAGDYIDFLNPNVKQMLINRYKRYFDNGLRGGMLDFAEMVPDNALYCTGITGREMHNFNPYWYGKLYGEAAFELVGNDYLYFCRGGCAGSQQWCAKFSGDQAATFFGLRQQLSSALTLGVCGFSAWGGDLAGYEMKPTPEVFIRGMQFSAFQPLMRAHGTRTRCPWDFGETAISVYQRYYYLRENLIDKIYSSAVSAHKTGLAMMQAMALAFPEQKELAAVDSQYLFCDDFLVAPVFETDATHKTVWFPNGEWYELWNGDRIVGGQSKDIEINLTDMPVYVREGAVIPLLLAPSLRFVDPVLDGESVKALLITPPGEIRKARVYSDQNNYTDYITQKNSDTGFTVIAENGYLPETLMVYGGVRDIKVNGKQIVVTKKMVSESITVISFKNSRGKYAEIQML